MKGTKRFAVSEPNPDIAETTFRNKRIMEGSPFDVYRAEPSQQPGVATPPFNMQRAVSSQQHVRALNTQFASWVQEQLKNHPDELWEDGLRDYLVHASSIMEKFSDVVNWLKANASMGENSPAAASFPGKKLLPDITNKENNFFGQKTGFTPVNSTPLFGIFPSTGISSNRQSTVLFGNQSSAPFNHVASNNVAGGHQSSAPSDHAASNNVDDENDLEQPSSPSLKKTEEKGIVVVHEVKCKLYLKSKDPADSNLWKDKGMGQLSIKCKEGFDKATRESKPIIIVRNEVGKVLLNAFLYPGIKAQPQKKNSLMAIFHTSGDATGGDGDKDTVVLHTYLFRVKTEEDRDKLATAIQEYAPVS